VHPDGTDARCAFRQRRLDTIGGGQKRHDRRIRHVRQVDRLIAARPRAVRAPNLVDTPTAPGFHRNVRNTGGGIDGDAEDRVARQINLFASKNVSLLMTPGTGHPSSWLAVSSKCVCGWPNVCIFVSRCECNLERVTFSEAAGVGAVMAALKGQLVVVTGRAPASVPFSRVALRGTRQRWSRRRPPISSKKRRRSRRDRGVAADVVPGRADRVATRA
jgi:hypothetical protein